MHELPVTTELDRGHPIYRALTLSVQRMLSVTDDRADGTITPDQAQLASRLIEASAATIAITIAEEHNDMSIVNTILCDYGFDAGKRHEVLETLAEIVDDERKAQRT